MEIRSCTELQTVLNYWKNRPFKICSHRGLFRTKLKLALRFLFCIDTWSLFQDKKICEYCRWLYPIFVERFWTRRVLKKMDKYTQLEQLKVSGDAIIHNFSTNHALQFLNERQTKNRMLH